jgi:peptidoglycan/LPS O-acetylase OafA/YrhL
VRAIAVGLVVAYHLGVPQAQGGLLGVAVFFTLSGHLITGILLTTWERTRRVGLGPFWIRRARRLLPAVVVLLMVVLAATALVEPASLGRRAPESLAALLYVANWAVIARGDSYFERVAGAGPLDHMWSLAVEEQFYLVWPLVLLVLVVVLRDLRKVAWATAGLAAGSFLLMALLAQPGFDNTRAYEGTDTRAGGLLVGAAVALLWRPGHLPLLHGRAGRARWDALGVIGLVLIGVLVATTGQYSMLLYRGGILALSLATAAVVLVVTHPASLLGWALGVRPLAWIGERSYGIYLWHLPVVAFTPTTMLADSPLLRGALQVALTIGIAALSWSLVEDPVRRHGFRGALQLRPSPRPGRRWAMPAIVTSTGVLALVGTVALTATAQMTGGPTSVASGTVDVDKPPIPPDATASPEPTASQRGSSVPSATVSGSAEASASSASTVLRTSCRQLVHVGDSTSVGLVDPAYQPIKKARIAAQYKRIGITDFQADIYGGRSIVETYKGQPNAQEAVNRRLAAGYDGCWVIAMGINEAANQYVGGTYPFDKRIDLLMRPIGDRPVLWLTGRTLRSSGAYGDAQMVKWNKALKAACSRYPNMRVYDWRAEVKRSWFVDDGIHFTAKGYRERAARIADAFARAFPADRPSHPGCIVESGR